MYILGGGEWGCETDPNRSVAAVGGSPECALTRVSSVFFPCVWKPSRASSLQRLNVSDAGRKNVQTLALPQTKRLWFLDGTALQKSKTDFFFVYT